MGLKLEVGKWYERRDGSIVVARLFHGEHRVWRRGEGASACPRRFMVGGFTYRSDGTREYIPQGEVDQFQIIREVPNPLYTHGRDIAARCQMIANVNAIASYCYQSMESLGWWNDLETGAPLASAPRIVEQKLCLIHSEVSEALEGHRKDLMDDKLPHRNMLEVELADAVIRIADLAGALKLDLGGALVEKMEYNMARADHKPENRAGEGGKAF